MLAAGTLNRLVRENSKTFECHGVYPERSEGTSEATRQSRLKKTISPPRKSGVNSGRKLDLRCAMTNNVCIFKDVRNIGLSTNKGANSLLECETYIYKTIVIYSLFSVRLTELTKPNILEVTHHSSYEN